MVKKWNKKKFIIELKKVIAEIKHFPGYNELISMHRFDIIYAMSKYGGFPKFRLLLGYKILRKQPRYWDEKTAIKRLKYIINKIHYFPSRNELIKMNEFSLIGGITRNGGLNKFRILLGYEPIHKPDGYWNIDTACSELKPIIEKLGHFPTQKELISMDRYDLAIAIDNRGGLNEFRKLLGYDILKKSNGFWTTDTMINEFENIINDIGRFPSQNELISMGKYDLSNAIQKHGGINKFRELLGESPSLYQQYISEQASYNVKKGKNTEKIIKPFLQIYCQRNGYPEPTYGKKLVKGHVLEFICNTGKTIGIDVTNASTKSTISRKYRRKSYHLYLDELWIVVFGTFTEKDYIKWNNEIPNNVKVMTVYEFLDELDYSIDSQTRQKIDKYCSCTFHTKEELKNNKQIQ